MKEKEKKKCDTKTPRCKGTTRREAKIGDETRNEIQITRRAEILTLG